ncbi:MAG TPA: HyaD/HybD family hydrogenase maturation endopeptidase [Cycloclasticus sp.]|jgi:hydrogenase maturation protease|nr:HyaD/HybD family hydrogenase maturation endopeptidase [Cycloclasticus sp.]HIL94108.1 HyaD/HybD family hydrogenase maturation endopeptidase [Cycloclasticus sp.]
MNKTLILGIGNILWADEGFGVRTVEHLNETHQFDENVTLMDGGTQGLYLVQYVEEADILVVFDAIDYGLEPGEMKLIEGGDVPKYMGAKKMSLHQTGFQEVLMMADMLERYPSHLLLVGVQPVELEDFGGSLREKTRQQIEPAINAALDWLKQFDIYATKRVEPIAPEHSLSGHEVSMDNYENDRPSAELASRTGDDRVIHSKAFHIEYKPHPLEQEEVISCDVDHRGKY